MRGRAHQLYEPHAIAFDDHGSKDASLPLARRAEQIDLISFARIYSDLFSELAHLFFGTQRRAQLPLPAIHIGGYVGGAGRLARQIRHGHFEGRLAIIEGEAGKSLLIARPFDPIGGNLPLDAIYMDM